MGLTALALGLGAGLGGANLAMGAAEGAAKEKASAEHAKRLREMAHGYSRYREARNPAMASSYGGAYRNVMAPMQSRLGQMYPSTPRPDLDQMFRNPVTQNMMMSDPLYAGRVAEDKKREREQYMREKVPEMTRRRAENWLSNYKPPPWKEGMIANSSGGPVSGGRR